MKRNIPFFSIPQPQYAHWIQNIFFIFFLPMDIIQVLWCHWCAPFNKIIHLKRVAGKTASFSQHLPKQQHIGKSSMTLFLSIGKHGKVLIFSLTIILIKQVVLAMFLLPAFMELLHLWSCTVVTSPSSSLIWLSKYKT